MARRLPSRFNQFATAYPDVAAAYEALGNSVHEAGPVDTKTRALVKLGVSVGVWLEGAVHSAVRKALDAGATAEEIRHTIILALPTIGFPSTMAALTWADDVLPKGRAKKRR